MKTCLCIDNVNIIVIRSKISSILHVYNDSDLQAVLRAPGEVTNICLSQPTDKSELWALYIVTSCDLYRITENQVREVQDKAVNRASVDSENQEIFSDLLSQGSDPNVSDCDVSTEPVLEVEGCHLIFISSHSINGFCVACSYVAMATVHNGTHVVHLYNEKDILQCHNEATVLTTYSVPVLSIPLSNDKNVTHKIFMVTCDVLSVECGHSLYTVHVNPDLFVSLFGQETVLLNSPVLLACPTDGCIYYAPLKSTDFVGSPSCSIDLKLLCPTSQSVISIVSSEVEVRKSKSSECFESDQTSDIDLYPEKRSMLLVVSRDGKLVGIVLDKDNYSAQFLSVVIQGPVVDFSVQGGQIFSSLGRDLFSSSLFLEMDLEGRMKMDISKTKMMQMANVSDVVCLGKAGDITGNTCALFCKMVSGDVKVIYPESMPRSTPTSQSLFNPGQRIKDLLLSIENCSSAREKLKLLQRKQQSFLSQLNIAAFLKYSCKSKHEKCDPIVDCLLKVSTPNSGRIDDILLCCHMTNRSQVTLSSDWRVVVKVTQDGKSDSTGSSACAVLVDGLKSGENRVVKCKLPSDNIVIPYRIGVYLCLQFPDEVRPNIKMDETLSVLIYTRTLDILDFMYEENFFKKCNHRRLLNSREIIQELAQRRAVARLFTVDLAAGDTGDQERCQLELDIPTLRDSKVEGVVMGEQQDEVGILQYLLKSCPEPVSVASKNSVSLVTFVGHKLDISVQKRELDRYKVSISANSMSLAAGVRQSVLTRLKALQIKGTGQEAENRVQQVQENMQSIQELLQQLQNQPDTNTTNGSERFHGILKCYQRLRNMRI